MNKADELVLREKDRTKISVMDEILHGKDIFIASEGSLEDNRRNWVLYSKAGRELFRWSKRKSVMATALHLEAKPLTLKEALELVEEHWEERTGAW